MLILVALTWCVRAEGQDEPTLKPESLPLSRPTIALQPGAAVIAHHKIVYRNDHAHFQFMPLGSTAYFTIWHPHCDPCDDECVTAKTYLTEIIAYPVQYPHYEIWENMERNPHRIQWRIWKSSSDGCHHRIDYRNPDVSERWCLYGYFEKDCPK